MVNQLTLFPQAQAIPRLRWSVSRDGRLRDCERRYYLHHYGSVGGKRADAPPQTRETYILKHLRNRFMWIGEIVHSLVETALQSMQQAAQPCVQDLIDRGVRRMRADFAESLHGTYRTRPGLACGLVEHAYSDPVAAQQWQAMRQRLERCLHNFMGMPLLQRMRQAPRLSWLGLEALSSFELEGATIVVKPDFAWRNPAGQVEMVDWKSGSRSPAAHRQMAVYGLFAQREWGLGGANMLAHVAYLDSGEVETFELTAAHMEVARAEIRTSVQRMQALARPPPGSDVPQKEAFAQVADHAVCGRCNFRRICGRG
jgi:hypothetical protein